MTTYTLPLGNGRTAKVELPSNMTEAECMQIVAFIHRQRGPKRPETVLCAGIDAEGGIDSFLCARAIQDDPDILHTPPEGAVVELPPEIGEGRYVRRSGGWESVTTP